MSNTPHLGLPLMAAAQAQKHVSHNEALFGLDALVHLAVLDRDLTTAPASPANGARYIVAGSGVGAWAGKGGQIAVWQDGAWRFHAPGRGWLAYVIDEGALLGWDGAAWTDALKTIAQFQNLTRLGLDTTADAVNPFSAKLNNALWTARTGAEGGTGDLRYKLNKESAAKTLSLLFQDGFSGRAEFGLVGDDDFRIKVSPDGAVWKEALRIDRVTGAVAFPSGGGAAGGIKNVVFNGNFAINQRSYTSGTALAGGAYAHDRWRAGSGGATYTFTAAKPDTTITISAGSLIQAVEDLNVEGGSYVLSWAGTAGARVGINGAVASYVSSPIAISGAAGGQQIAVEFGPGTLGKVQLEPGISPTSFERRPSSVELGLCRWYFERIHPPSGSYIGVLLGDGSTTAYTFLSWSPKRTYPSVAATSQTAFSLGGAATTAIGVSGASGGGGLLSASRATAIAMGAIAGLTSIGGALDISAEL